MKPIQHAIIMAAGRGQRMLPLTADIPKAMVTYDGSSLIAKGIETIKKQIPNVHITVGHKKAMLAMHVIEHHVSSVFNTEGKGNSWWIYNTLVKHLDEPVLVLTCDNIVELNTERILENYRHHGAPACMVIPVKPVAGLDGDFIFHKNNIVYKLSREDRAETYCSGIQVLNPFRVNAMTEPGEDFYFLWEQLIGKKQLVCSDVHPEKWFTVDTPEQLDRLKNTR